MYIFDLDLCRKKIEYKYTDNVDWLQTKMDTDEEYLE